MTEQATFKTVPHNLEAEQALLGILLFDPASFAGAEGVVRGVDFYEPVHGLIFAAIVNLRSRGEAVTGPAIFERIKTQGAFQAMGGADYLHRLANSAPLDGISGYAATVADLSVKRQMIAFADLIRRDALGEETAAKIIALAEGRLGEVARGMFATDHWVDMAALVSRVGDILSGRAAPGYVTTGYDGWDDVMGGLRFGRMTVLAGRPSMGKSAVMTAMARRIAQKGVPVGVFSLEMDEDEIALRLAADAAYDPGEMHNPVYFDAQRGKILPEMAERMAYATQPMRGLPMWFDCRPGLKPSSIVHASKRLIRRIEKQGIGQKGVLIVDHMHIVAPEEDDVRRSRVEQVGAISRALSELAKDTGWAVLVLAQLSRDVDSRKNPDKRPQMSDLRWAGEIEQDANTVVFIYRPEKYLREPENPHDIDAQVAYEEERARVRNVVEFLIEKNRGGAANVKHVMKISVAHNAMWEERVAA